MVDRTEPNGLVKRKQDPNDTRAVRVALTPKGAKLAEEFYDDACNRIEKLSESLSETEHSRLANLLGRVVSDNEVPVVFMKPDESTPETRSH